MLMVYVEPIEGQGFRATVEAPVPLVAEGTTREEAVSRIKAMVRDRIDSEDIFWPPEDQEERLRIWKQYAGDMKDDPLLDEWKEAMAEYRRGVDAADNAE